MHIGLCMEEGRSTISSSANRNLPKDRCKFSGDKEASMLSKRDKIITGFSMRDGG